MEPMFEIPGTDVSSVHITEEVVSGKAKPQYNRSASATPNVDDVYDRPVGQERAINT